MQFSISNLSRFVKSAILLAVCGLICNYTAKSQARWITGDFHQHTTYTDGSYTLGYMMDKNNAFGLDWWANSEHGGGFNTNGTLSGKDINYIQYWDSTSFNPIIGKKDPATGHQNMWRWQSLRDFSFKSLQFARNIYRNKTIIQGYEWNPPGHEHCSFAIIANQFGESANVNPLAEFEYKFDANDLDSIGGANQGWTKSALTGHAKTIEAATWCETNYKNTSWMVLAHPERKSKWDIKSIRDMNTAAPDVCIGFESMPGHQKAAERGEYKTSYNTDGVCTYGGTGIYAAKVGGMWDAILSEGRKYWLFANSDSHDTIADFFPGQYQKNYIYSTNNVDPQAIVNGMRSGAVFVVQGDLIDSLVFKVENVGMGESVKIQGQEVNVLIRIHSSDKPNNNIWSDYRRPVVDHIDLIGGKLLSKFYTSADAEYNAPSVSTTKVIARFDAKGNVTDASGLVSSKWSDIGGGWKEMTLKYTMQTNMYFRLRGSNLGLNVANETDANGNPLADTLMGVNDAKKAFADLWFYSNPIFVRSSILGIKAVNDDDKFQIFPNPTTGLLNVKCPVGSTMTIISIDGKELYKNVLNQDLNSINVDSFLSGVYTVRFESAGETSFGKFVKE